LKNAAGIHVVRTRWRGGEIGGGQRPGWEAIGERVCALSG